MEARPFKTAARLALRRAGGSGAEASALRAFARVARLIDHEQDASPAGSPMTPAHLCRAWADTSEWAGMRLRRKGLGRDYEARSLLAAGALRRLAHEIDAEERKGEPV